MDKRFLAVLAVIAAILIGVFAFTNKSSNNQTNSTSTNKPTSHIEGQGKKHVTLIEYGDYECPVCEQYYAPLQQVAAKYSQDIYFQFRNLPLVQIHPNALAGAKAAEAADLQGKFWQMHDRLYENQNEWANSSDPVPFFNTYAQQLGLDVNQFKQDYTSDLVNSRINADVAEFDKSRSSHATPTFFLDGKKIDNPQASLEDFSRVLDAEIAKQNPAKQ